MCIYLYLKRTVQVRIHHISVEYSNTLVCISSSCRTIQFTHYVYTACALFLWQPLSPAPLTQLSNYSNNAGDEDDGTLMAPQQQWQQQQLLV